MWTLAAGAAAGAAGMLAYAVRGRSATLLSDSVHRGTPSRHSVALTFDDGPTRQTEKVLRILDRYRVRATFFQCGIHVRRDPDIARSVAAAGHEIGNHSDSHPCFLLRSPGFIESEMRRAQESIAEAVGVSPLWFRPPYGIRWFGMREAQRSLNLTGVMWTVIGKDWNLRAREVRDRVLRSARPGAIICLHDGRAAEPNPRIDNTLRALEDLIPDLLRRNYRFETVTELLCTTN